ncbi:MAG: hypothetical protein HC862_30940 [Scytonema sp. RU_4_4]|nr:hypothetical protein [Scytonema sp. RU_4_4]NJR73800.1 hypothetical protein [Scytonema sp. CRU_2_7]
MNKQMPRNSMARRSMASLCLQQKAQLKVLSTLTWQALTLEPPSDTHRQVYKTSR